MKEENNMKHLVIGSEGEVGQALVKILESGRNIKGSRKVYKHDLQTIHPLDIKCDVLHICFPYSNDFEFHVINYVEKFGVNKTIVVIHSTVVPHTTSNLAKVIDNVIYSPTRGRHPNLFDDILFWTKYLASESEEALGIMQKIYHIVGLKTKIVKDTTSLEFAKHYSTLMFGLSLVVTQEVYAAKKAFNVDPEIIMEFINDTGRVTKDRKIYPFIESIGGHCVIPNAKLFQSYSQFAFYVLRFNKLFSQAYPDKKYELKKD
jgi:UDP-N-acetyl-D-mannosaminuronate dehydrogenase